MGNIKTVKVNDCEIGGDRFIFMAGPCSVESEEQIMKIATLLDELKIHILRGGAFKPRTSPVAFQGLGLEGLKLLRKAADKYKLLVVTEVMDTKDISLISEYADILQVGTRNMFNYSLLKELGKARKAVLLKRSFMATIEEYVMASEYILQGGNEDLIYCERGIRTFMKETRFTLDISAIPLIKQMTNRPVIIDPSHATGIRSLILPMTKAGLVTGASGAMIEVHPDPDKALSDGAQSLNLNQFRAVIEEVRKLENQIKASD
ncbi:MAG: 3-deoxy-7-phosphoheptulonate synthase [Candidatus Coatesbacteria bacterium]|nr:3-deoxy-7-phosphoheptulonate synthase [Candidatus Coatesbacteria bacterium]